MFRAYKVLTLVVVFALLFVGVPLVGAQNDQPPQPQPPQPPQPTSPNVNVNVGLPWGTILVMALVLGILILLIAVLGRNTTSTHTVEHIEEHHHDIP